MATTNVGNTEEVWKDLSEYEGYYQVSTLGNVRSLDRYVTNSKGATKFKSGITLKYFENKGGYRFYSLNKEGKFKLFYGHYLVMRTFVGERPFKRIINHKNCIRSDNRLVNLEYITYAQNIQYAFTVPLESRLDYPYQQKPQKVKKSCPPLSILTKDVVVEIRKLRKQGMLFVTIARMFNIDIRNVVSAATNKRYDWADSDSINIEPNPKNKKSPIFKDSTYVLRIKTERSK